MKKTPIFIMFALLLLVACKKKTEGPDPNYTTVTKEKDKGKITLSIESFVTNLDENPNADKSLGKVIAKASDEKVMLTFELQNQSRAEALRIDAKTGVLTVNDVHQFDYESTENHSITAQCLVKGGEQSITGNITITLNDVKGEPFVTKWEVSDKETIVINHVLGESGYDLKVNWGDGSALETFATQPAYQHYYIKGGDYEVTITGTYPGFSIQTQKAFTTVIAWGDNEWKNMGWMFSDCDNFKTIDAKDQPDLRKCTKMLYVFYQCNLFDGDVSHWNTENVKTMEGIFYQASAFSGDISQWNTSKVESMAYMFSEATSFNHDVSDWDVKKVVNSENFANGSILTCNHVPNTFTNSGCNP